MKGDIKITFKSGFEDIGVNLIKSKKENDAKKKETAYETYQRERKQKRRERKLKDKEKQEMDNKLKYKKPEERTGGKYKKKRTEDLVSKNAATKEELALVLEGDETNEDFKPNTADTRFEAIYDSGAFNMDPTHKDFKKAGTAFVEEHQKRRRKHAK